MKKFLVLYNSSSSAVAEMVNMTAEQKAKGMEGWMKWKATNEDALVNFGAPLLPAQGLDAAGKWVAVDNEATGFSIVQGEDAESVKAIFKDHPHISWRPGCSIAVHEFMPM